jgi:uncharacterized membrane protein
MAKTQTKKPLTLQVVYPYILIIGSIIGLYAAGVLMHDKLKLLTDTNFNPNCNLNPIFSCTSVMQSTQASAFNFPNPILGLAGFGMVLAAGMSLLAIPEKVRLKRWYWLALQAGTLFGVLFIHWLFYQSVYRIGALCLYCMAVWSVTVPIFWYTLLYNLREGHIKTPKPLLGIVRFAQANHIGIMILWYLLIGTLIVKRFWYFFGPG